MLELYKKYTIEELNEILWQADFKTMSEVLEPMNEKQVIQFYGAGKFTTTNSNGEKLTLRFEIITMNTEPETIKEGATLYIYEMK
jgi:hypothetical protein